MEIKNLGQLVQMLATKAGIDAADMHLVHVLSNSELSRITLHGDMAKMMSENLISLDEAKSNHPQIGHVYKAQTLNAFDKKMDEVAVAAGLDEGTVAALKGVKNSYKRFEMLVNGIQNSKAKIQKENATGLQPDLATVREETRILATPSSLSLHDAEPQSGDAHAGAPLQDETFQQSNVATTSNNLPTTSNHDARIAELQALRKADKVQYELKTILAGVPTIYDELPVKARGAALDAIISHALHENDVVFDFDEQDAFTIRANGEGKELSSLLGKDGVTPQLFIDAVLAQNKILRVAMPPRTMGSDEGEGKAVTPRTITANPNGLQGHNEVASLNRRMREQARQ